MAVTNQHTAFLCGHFKMSANTPHQQIAAQGWKKFIIPEDIRKTEKRFFYPEFVDFCYSDETDKNCVRYVRNIDETQDIILKGKTLHYTIKEITLYLMPFGMAMFSIHIEQETSCLDDCTSLLFQSAFYRLLHRLS